ncbi:MAG: hypothetical protein R8P61_34940 [Bacteroidia bacterium]|nr:hypothetical protein [Bacteroidia bacterium]
MFRKIFSFEFTSWLKSPTIYVYGLSFFAIAFLSLAGSLGVFDELSPKAELQSHLNSPYEVSYILFYFNKIFLFLLPAIIGATIYKDFRHNLHSILYSFPIKKHAYLGGKFLSAFSITLAISLFAASGLVFAELMPGADPSKLGPFSWGSYMQAFSLFLIPNLLFQGLIVFSLVLLSRNVISGFLGVVVLFLIQVISENAFAGHGFWVALLDPFAQNTSLYESQFWTLSERNVTYYSLQGVLLYNRIFWLGLSFLLGVYTYRKFQFHQEQQWKWQVFNKKKSSKEESSPTGNISIPQTTKSYGWKEDLRRVLHLSFFNLRFIIKNWTFLAIALISCLSVIFSLGRITRLDEMVLLPTTQLMLRIPAFFFLTFTMLLTFIYAGSLMQRDRMTNMYVLIDSSPVRNGVLLISRLLALLLMQLLMLFLMIVCGIGVQASQAYFHFELDLYVSHLYGLRFWGLMVWAITAVFVHSFFPNLYQGLFALVLLWLGISGMPSVGLDSHVLLFNSPPELSYSDLNAYDHQLPAFALVQGYWLIGAFLLFCLSLLIWERGVSLGIKERWLQFRSRLNKSWYLNLGILSVAFISLGANILWEEHEREVISNEGFQASFKTFKKEFKQYEKLKQPRIKALNLEMDLYPEKKSFTASGSYLLINPHEVSLDTLLVRTGFDEETELDFAGKADLLLADSIMHFSVWVLKRSLLPKDSMHFSFSVQSKGNTLFEQYPNVKVNGSFLREDALPRLGYIRGAMEPEPNSTHSREFNYQSWDSDHIDMDIRLSTSSDQIAIAPGQLIESYSKDRRKYFHYKSQRPLKYALGILSGDYEQKESNWQHIAIRAFYHPGHDKNLETMMDGLKAALAYNSQYFGPYQHASAEIVEFPLTDGTFSTTYANISPTSEFRFISNASIDSQKVDLSFYTAAHELSHQWWGAQLIPAHAKGARMLSESTTEYISLNIFRKAFGEKQARKFLGLQRSRYLNGRANLSSRELPLYRVKASDQFMFYGKGTMAFHALAYLIGEEEMNRILGNFLDVYRFKGPPYPLSIDFLSYLKEESPDSLNYLIEDYFEKVILHDGKIEHAEMRQQGSGYELEVELSLKKEEHLDIGQYEELPLDDLVEIGIYDAKDELIRLERFWMKEGRKSLKFNLEKQAAKVVLDPNLLQIDRDLRDNSIEVE